MLNKRTERLRGLSGGPGPEAREHRQSQTKWFALLNGAQTANMWGGRLEPSLPRWLRKRFGVVVSSGT